MRSISTGSRASRWRSLARCFRLRPPPPSSRSRSRTCASVRGVSSSRKRTSTTAPPAAAEWARWARDPALVETGIPPEGGCLPASVARPDPRGRRGAAGGSHTRGLRRQQQLRRRAAAQHPGNHSPGEHAGRKRSNAHHLDIDRRHDLQEQLWLPEQLGKKLERRTVELQLVGGHGQRKHHQLRWQLGGKNKHPGSKLGGERRHWRKRGQRWRGSQRRRLVRQPHRRRPGSLISRAFVRHTRD
jgi:hypothetical protein